MLDPGIFFILLDLREGEKRKEKMQTTLVSSIRTSFYAPSTMEDLMTRGLHKFMTLFLHFSKRNDIGAIDLFP